MTPGRWQEVKALLADALECDDPGARESFLTGSCAGDTSLRREVDSLLEQDEDEFEECARSVARHHQQPSSADNVGRQIGSYELVRELGRGGMGTVWLARRADQQFEKQVAIKLLKRGSDSAELLRRFDSERRILARLEHPNIARLIDGGTTDDGFPYFVMEYVEGTRVTDYCFALNLSIRQRLELFRKICAAVQFAHQNLVVHRDLKPANILITATGEPKLLDFGIAKLVASDIDSLEVTLSGCERLTPAYASPEQIRGEAVTTVSDIYALGALLYQSLTDVPPHRFSQPRPSPNEILRVICEEEVTPPAKVVRHPRLCRELRGDLDSIVLRAMAKEPARRYPSASNFADDVQRYLEGRPVRARPDTVGYRTRKFVWRNKSAVAVSIAVAAALLAGAIGIISKSRLAQRRFDDVRQLADSFLFEFDDAIANLPGATPARRLLVSRGLEYLDKLARESRYNLPLQLDLADAYLKIGDVQGRPYVANLGDTDGAIRSYDKAIAIAQPLSSVARGAALINARRILAQAYENKGVVCCRLSRVEEATRDHEEAFAIATSLLAQDPKHATDWKRMLVRNRLGIGDAIMAGNHLNADIPHYRAALAHYREALPLAEELVHADPESAPDAYRLMQTSARIAAMLSEIGAGTNDQNALQEAFAFHNRTLALDEAALQKDPGNALLRRCYAGELTMTAYANVLANQNLDETVSASRKAVEIDQALTAADPNNAEAKQDLAHDYYVIGRALQLKHDFQQASDLYRAAIAILEPLTALHPDNIETAYDLSRAQRGLAEVSGRSVAGPE